MFLLYEASPNIIPRKHEKFKVNMALTEMYKNSAIPQLQRKLNEFFMVQELKDAN